MGTLTNKGVDAFNELLVISQLRGPHSTGIASIPRGSNKADLLKSVGTPDVLMSHKKYDSFVGIGKKVIIGHNRHATVGDINRTNAHPFDFETLVGAHNGTIPHNERSKLENHNEFGTDSEALLNMIDKEGPHGVIPKIHGAWALVWYDKEDNTLNFLRNNARDLFYAYSADKKMMFWASEVGMLRMVLDRNGIDIFEEKVWQVPADRCYQFIVPEKHGDPILAPTSFEVKAKEVRHTPVAYNFREKWLNEEREKAAKETSKLGKEGDDTAYDLEDGFFPYMDSTGGIERTIGRGADTPWKDDKEGEWATIIPATIKGDEPCLQAGPAGGFRIYTQREFKGTGETCSYCDSVIGWEDLMKGSSRIEFTDQNIFMCDDCASKGWIKDWYNPNRNKIMGMH